MKAGKIRTVVILLLIIFFSIILLFAFLRSQNIYEGVIVKQNNKQTAAAPPKDLPIYKDLTLSFSKDSTNYGKVTNIPVQPIPSISSGEYIIDIYYFMPTTMNNTIGLVNIAIADISHNLPDTHKLYFSNMNNPTAYNGNYSPSTSATSIYIEKNNSVDTSSNIVIKKCRIIECIKNPTCSTFAKLVANSNSSTWNPTTGILQGGSGRNFGAGRLSADTYLVEVPSSSSKKTIVRNEYKYSKLGSMTKNAITRIDAHYGIGGSNYIYPPTSDTSNKTGIFNLSRFIVTLF